MVFTLHQYILRELLRVFVLATVTLTFVLSLSSMLRPIQDFGVGPSQAIHILGYFIPIMLTVVLPMSALFSAALVYGRFASDNELDACRASGISLMTLIYPGLCLAVAISITTLILSFHVVPAFVARAEKSIQGNAKQILFRNIQRKGFYELPGGRYRIYADHANASTDTLVGVIVVDAKNSSINKRMFARRAKIEIETTRDSTIVAIIAQEAYQIDEHNLQSVHSREVPVTITFPPMLSDDIKFQKLDKLKEIQADMSNFKPVRDAAIAAKTQLATELLCESIEEQIAKKDDNYYQLRSENRVIMFTAAGCSVRGKRTVILSPPVELREYDTVLQELLLKWHSDEPGTIEFKDDVMDPAPVVILENASWQRAADGYKSPTPVPKRVIEGLALSGTIKSKLQSKKLLDLMDTIPANSAEPILENPPSGELSHLYDTLKYEMWVTSKDIISEIHSRLVFGIGSIVLILIAIALGISLKGGHMLSAFGTSALPAGALVVFVLSGKQLTKTRNVNVPEYAGTLVMWLGVVLLCIVTVMIYRKLMRT